MFNLVYSASICQPVQAVCKTKQANQKSVAEGGYAAVHILFIPAAAAEGRLFCQGYLLWKHCG